ncbi:MAG: NAD(P)H-binding protein [Microbacteriaceae bacterium]|nr:NAD(P)H-binding protein [Microbacteriaceae bacterium]
MPLIVVTGVNGYIGNAVAGLLLADGVPAGELRVTSRSADALATWRELGVDARLADFDDPASLLAAFDGADRVFHVSTLSVGPNRKRQHRNVVDAAVAAGAGYLLYTSFLNAEKPEVNSVEVDDHKDTERAILESGLRYNFLRNNQYADAMAENVAAIGIRTGTAVGNWGDGRVGFVWRDDVAEVAAKLLQGHGEDDRGYEVTGPELLSLRDVAALVSECSGVQVAPIDMTDDEMYGMWDALGVPRTSDGDFTNSPTPWASDGMVTFGVMIRDHHLEVLTDTVERFTGHAPRTLRELMALRRPTWPAAPAVPAAIPEGA